MALRLLYTLSATVAAALTVLAALLVWASLRVPLLGTVTRYGWQGDGIITLLLGLLGLAFALNTWVERRPATFRLTALFTAFLGALIFATALVNLLDTERAVGAAQDDLGVNLSRLIGLDLQSFVDAGEGVFVAIAAGLLLTAGSSVAFAAALASQDRAVAQGRAGCPRCRAEPPPAARFCPACGAPLK